MTLTLGCGQSVPHNTRSGALSISFLANGTASWNGFPAPDARSRPVILTQHFSSFFWRSSSAVKPGSSSPLRRLHRTHVIDDVARRQRGEDGRKFGHRTWLEIDVDMPAELGDPMHDALELVHVADAAKPLQEGEAAAADAALVERLELLVGHLVFDVGNAFVGAFALRDGVGHDAVVGAVHRGIDDHTALDADLLVH